MCSHDETHYCEGTRTSSVEENISFSIVYSYCFCKQINGTFQYQFILDYFLCLNVAAQLE